MCLAAFQESQNLSHRHLTQRFEVLPHSRKRRRCVRCGFDIVEPDNPDISRNHDATFRERAEQSQRHLVVRDKDRVGRFLLKQLSRRSVTGCCAPISPHKDALVTFAISPRTHALLSSKGGKGARKMGDPAIPTLSEIPQGSSSTAEVIRAYSDDVRGGWSIDRNKSQSRRKLYISEQSARFIEHNNAVNALPVQPGNGLPSFNGSAERHETNRIVMLSSSFGNGLQDKRVTDGRERLRDDPDRSRTPCAQGARRAMRTIAESIHRIEDALARCLVHTRAVVRYT